MPRLRLGVVLLIPPPLDGELNALRRALGDGTYGRVPVHLTLVPPVNVNQERFADVLAVLRQAAAATRPFPVHLGPPATFLPASPVLYLPVAGAGRAEIYSLRERVFQEPLARPLSWPFVPHVTLADEAREERITAAETALCDYEAATVIDRVHVLQEGPGRVWSPVADAAFVPAAVVGRGGLPLELSVVQRLDPEASAFAEAEWEGEGLRLPHAVCRDESGLAVVGRREGKVVGTAEGRGGGGTAELTRLVVARQARSQGIGSHLVAAFESAAAAQGWRRLAAGVPAETGVEALLRGRGWVEECRLRRWFGDTDLVYLRRDL